MSIDPYAPCPCGSGKKLKFCCSDLASDIEKIEKLISGDQPHAALRHVERLLEKQPERASLLDLRASLELSLDELEKARETIQRYLQLHPDNPSAYGQAAILAAATGETAAAVGALQAAMERLPGDSLPQRLYEAYGSVGHALLLAGDLVAARAHLTFYANVSPEDDPRGIDLLMRLNLQGRPPLLLREQLRLADPPEEASWKSAFEAANRWAGRGLWQRAEAEYVSLLESISPESAAPVVHNLALVRGWLGDTPRFAAGLREYARLEVPWEDAVEAYALAELVDPSPEESIVETVQKRFAISDADQVLEQLLAERRAIQVEIKKREDENDDEGPPRAEFVLLDRPPLASADDVEPEDVPTVIGWTALYGKRTDREAMLTLTADEGPPFDGAMETIQQALGDQIGEELQSQIVHAMPRSSAVLQWRWHLPRDIDPAQRERLHYAHRRKVLLDIWGDTPMGMLGGRTPHEAVGDAAQQIPLAAAVLYLEQGLVSEHDDEMACEVRRKLQLPEQETIEPDQVDLMRMPLTRVHRLNFPALPDDRITPLLARLMMAGAERATKRLAAEIVRRVEEEGADLDALQAYRELAKSTASPHEALELVGRAKVWAEQHGHSTAEWGLRELQLQLELQSPEGISDAVAYLEQRHSKNPEVHEAIYRLLYAAGLGPLLEQGHQFAQAPTPEQESPAPAIWTPDAPPSSPSGKGTSAIWTP